tara:strand:+ start:15 stop:647 length:633 start_codon:yes stop_codon:yes gene_type:complete
MSKLETNTIDTVSGTSTLQVGSTNTSTITLGVSGDTINVPSGVTIANSGTATGFGGITMEDMWRLTTNYSKSGSGTADLTTNWERADSYGYAQIGTGMTESSGVFSFPSTGIYHVSFKGNMYADGGARLYIGGIIYVTTNNSSYNNAADSYDSAYTGSAYGNFSTEIILDVTDTSTHKVKFGTSTAGSTVFEGDTNTNRTHALFIRLGDT